MPFLNGVGAFKSLNFFSNISNDFMGFKLNNKSAHLRLFTTRNNAVRRSTSRRDQGDRCVISRNGAIDRKIIVRNDVVSAVKNLYPYRSV